MRDEIIECDIVEFVRDVLKIELNPHQEDFLKRMEAGEKVTFVTRAIGKRGWIKILDDYEQFKKGK